MREDSHGIAMRREAETRPGRRCGRGIGAVVLTLALSCASHQTIVVWEKPGATDGELEAARATCLAELDAMQDAPGVNRMRLEADATGGCFVACMRRHGFTWRTVRVKEGEPIPEASPAAEPQPPLDVPPPADCAPGSGGSDVSRAGS